MLTLASSTADTRLVLDTNVVLDWLVFRDVSTRELQLAVSEQRVRLLAHELSIDELRRVLGYPQFKLDVVQREQVLQHYISHTMIAALPDGFSRDNLLLPTNFPRCRDRDDQHFLALAYHGHADALVTKDRDILRLRKRARRFGVSIVSAQALLANSKP